MSERERDRQTEKEIQGESFLKTKLNFINIFADYSNKEKDSWKLYYVICPIPVSKSKCCDDYYKNEN